MLFSIIRLRAGESSLMWIAHHHNGVREHALQPPHQYAHIQAFYIGKGRAKQKRTRSRV